MYMYISLTQKKKTYIDYTDWIEIQMSQLSFGLRSKKQSTNNHFQSNLRMMSVARFVTIASK